jgi:hypothetical protein
MSDFTEKTDRGDNVTDLGCTPNGAHLYRRPDGVGGYVYTSDEVGGGVVVWNTSLVSEGTLLAAILGEHNRKCQEERARMYNKWK